MRAMMKTKFGIDNEADIEYFDACARIRGISVNALCKRLMRAIAQDQMIASVLDDEGKRDRQRGERGPRRYQRAPRLSGPER